MSTNFEFWDYLIFICYAVLILGIGLWVSRDKKGHQKNAEDYFLASKSLPWWAIGASLIAANISAEQFIGMSGSGFASGLAIASYEWMAAITLIIVGKYFLPIFIKKGIYTIPEFVEQRYSTNLKTILAVFWIGLYVFVNLTSVLYLGALALETIIDVPIVYGVIGLSTFFSSLFLIWWLISSSLDGCYPGCVFGFRRCGHNLSSSKYVSGGDGVIAGFKTIYNEVPGRFEMILDKSNPEYKNLPGLGVLVGGLWVANLYYWGFNQYIIQRTLAAKSLKESQKGILFAAFLKLIIPLIVVIPGIAAYVIVNDPELLASLGDIAQKNLPSVEQADKAYPWLLQLLPVGLKGLAFAALSAAIVSSLASMLNSTSTIFTMDIYKPYINKNANDKTTVNVGRLSAGAALIIGCIIAPFLENIDQAFQFIQEYSGIVSPGILAVFLLGLFWKKTTNKAAIIGVLSSIPIAMYFKIGPNGWVDNPFFVNIPFLDQMGYTLLLTMLIIGIVSYTQHQGKNDEKGIPITKELFKTSPLFNIGAFAIMIILVVLYAMFWS